MDLKGPQASNIIPVFRLTKAQPIVKKQTLVREYTTASNQRPNLASNSSTENILVGFSASQYNSSTNVYAE